jgi:hypothetical protein
MEIECNQWVKINKLKMENFNCPSSSQILSIMFATFGITKGSYGSFTHGYCNTKRKNEKEVLRLSIKQATSFYPQVVGFEFYLSAADFSSS